MAELALVVKATVALALALCATRLLGGASASVRSLVLACAFGLLVLLPVASTTLPARAIELPAAYAPFAAAIPLPATPVAGPSFTTDVRQASNAGFSWPSARSIVFMVWAIGAAGFAAPLLVGLFRLRRIRAHGRPWTHASLSSSVDLLLHDQVRVPITCGALRPVIALPIDAPQWSASDLRRVLLHEQEHVRRRDWLVHLGARAICALYWFHPLVWIALRQLCLESERACDDAVLREEDGAEYAAQLVSLAKRISKHDALPLLSIAGPSNLATRVGAMLTANVARGPVGTAAAVAVAGLAAMAALGIGPLQAVASIQQAPARSSGPSFEWTSIRPGVRTERCQPPDCQVRYSADGRMSGSSVDLVDLIVSAYDLYNWQVVGAPKWAGRDDTFAPRTGANQFDVQAAARPKASPDDMRQMLKTMLADRFHLVVRQETRKQQIYELVVEPGGHKLQPPGDRRYVASEDVWLRVNPANMMATLRVDQLTMAQLARNMGGVLRTMVVDRTGLRGAYRVDVRWDAYPNRPDVLQQPTSASPRDPQRPTVFEAFPQRLGLRLRQVSGAVEYLVVERAERPALAGAR